jgi:methionine-rich copper-binding protein CopC
MMLYHAFRRGATPILAAALAVALLPGVVLGHADLVTPSPADKSTATELVTVVSGVFSEAMKPDGSSLNVKDATGATVATGTVDPADATRMVATPSAALGSGAYTVEWTSVATDGHVARGTWGFKVAIAPTPSPTAVATAAPNAAPTAQPTAAPTASASAPAPSAGPTPAPSAGGGTSGSGGDVVLPIIVALIILGAGAAYLLTRRNRPTDPT